ncbi:MAG: hypothetical protein HOV81_10555 [Kofleriaceae bacterium]|nr:hypothetical protein [Kofleriaceae bacterium]
MNALYTIASLALLVGCSRSEPSSGTGSASTQPRAARETFTKRCAPCHGETGRGDGAFAAKLPTKPPDFADVGWQKGVTDDELRKAIVGGGVAVGKGSAMPAAHDLDGKPELDEIVAIVRSFATDPR